MSNINIEPAGYRVLVEPDGGEKTTDSGIVIPETSRMEQDTGTLVAKGDLAWADHPGRDWAAIGDRVMFAKYGGKFVTDPATHKEYKLMNDEDISCVIKSSVFSDDRNDQ